MGRCGCANITDFVTNGPVCLVANGTDNRRSGCVYSISQLLVVKAPEVFNRPASTAENKGVVVVVISGFKGFNKAASCQVPLNLRWINGDACNGEATFKRGG